MDVTTPPTCGWPGCVLLRGHRGEHWAAPDPNLEIIEADWDYAASTDALFNIVTLAGKADGGWAIEDFYAHGRLEIDAAMKRLETMDLKGKGQARGRALDFGCGAGRLTVSLARHFREVVGIDISKEMITLAREHCPKGLRCHYHHNSAPNLKLFRAGSFDLIYSMIVFQHMPPDLQEGYVHEVVRVLRKTGAAMIEIPDGPHMPHHQRWLSMWGVSHETVEGWVTAAGGRVVDVFMMGNDSAWEQNVYTIVKDSY